MKKPDLYCPPNRQAWREWLAANHQQQAAVWLVLYKKQSPGHNLSWSEAVDEALCFGWIDSTKKTIDAERYQQYFTKRKAKSNWSKVNKAKVQTLIDQGLMEPAGYKSIEIAKANGSWTILDDVEALVLPGDLKAELAKRHGALEYFDGLSKSNKKILLHWVVSAKRPATRQKRITEIGENAANQLKPKQFR
ncbi:YdeI/OmpD-associated family protein [Carboxylicivirga sediminis]|uniref:YdeI/OmpD-associated family protein n=1 Tax=Carboxylicivirga sediminis TaxID=2006564 RepID=A0A941FB09_9BACT|nr:YdeI/OmpD-associated family protein [Carboxylicivirga sediminis]MBR8538343.1 YdeI/OmpD-associated family protein [Carboxylicivirga sediminis]